MSVLPVITQGALAKTFSANAYLDINGGLELLDVLVERLRLSPASLCQVCILIHNANVMEALSMPDEMDHLHTQCILVSPSVSLQASQVWMSHVQGYDLHHLMGWTRRQTAGADSWAANLHTAGHLVKGCCAPWSAALEEL